MNENREMNTHLVLPSDTAEAAELFVEFSSRKKEGNDIRVRLTDSPFEMLGGTDVGICTSAVSSAGMDSIGEISKSDLLAVCGGGVKLGDLRGEVEGQGLFFPFDPELAAEDVTLAQLVMGGAVSRYEGRYGRLREYILSIELVTGAGKIIRTGTRSVKNVAGYEIAGFALGGGSTCGLICSVTLRLLPAPEAISVAVIPGEYGRLVREEAGHHIGPDIASIEIYHGSSAGMLLGRDPADMGVPAGPDGAFMLVESHGKGSGEGLPLLGLRRSMVDRISADADIEYIAMDLKGEIPAEAISCDGWSSLRPNRTVMLNESDTVARKNCYPGGRIASGTIGRVEGRPLVRRMRRSRTVPGQDLALDESSMRGNGDKGIGEIQDRLDDLFDPEGILIRD